MGLVPHIGIDRPVPKNQVKLSEHPMEDHRCCRGLRQRTMDKERLDARDES